MEEEDKEGEEEIGLEEELHCISVESEFILLFVPKVSVNSKMV